MRLLRAIHLLCNDHQPVGVQGLLAKNITNNSHYQVIPNWAPDAAPQSCKYHFIISSGTVRQLHRLSVIWHFLDHSKAEIHLFWKKAHPNHDIISKWVSISLYSRGRLQYTLHALFVAVPTDLSSPQMKLLQTQRSPTSRYISTTVWLSSIHLEQQKLFCSYSLAIMHQVHRPTGTLRIPRLLTWAVHVSLWKPHNFALIWKHRIEDQGAKST